MAAVSAGLSIAAMAQTTTFTTSGTYTVPAGVTSLFVQASGAGGGGGGSDGVTAGAGGQGARVIGTLPVTPGQQLTVTLGSANDATFSGVIVNGLNNTTSIIKAGNGTQTFSGANTYTGTTTVSAGKLQLGANGTLPSTSATTVSTGATLAVNGKTQTLASLSSSGTLDLGTNGSLTLSGSSSIGAISGSGTITVNSGAVLTLTSALNNANVNIVLAGGTLNLGVGLTHTLMGTLSLTANSTLDFVASQADQLTVSTFSPSTFNLTVSNWVLGSDKFVANAITGNPAKNTSNLVPLNQVTLSSAAASRTLWTSAFEITLGATVKVQTTTTGGYGGPSSFTQTNLASAPANITTTASGTPAPAAPAAITVTALGTAITLTETPGPGSGVTAASCTDANSAATGNTGSTFATLSGGILTIPAANVKAGADFTCVFTNGYSMGTYWDGPAVDTATIEGGTGTWSATNANWTSSTGVSNGLWDTGKTAIFGVTTATSTVTVSGTQNINGLTFNTTGYTLSGGTLNTTAATTLTADANVSATVSSVISGSNAITKAGDGTVVLSGANTYSGATTVSAGTLEVGDSALSSIGFVSTTVNAGATLVLKNSFSGFASRRIMSSISGAGTVSAQGAGTGVSGAWLGYNSVVSLTGQINVVSGLFGTDNTSANWSGTTADVAVSAGAVFTHRGNSIRIGGLNGAGDVAATWIGQSTQILSIGAGDKSGSFMGVIHGNATSGEGTLEAGITNIAKIGTGTQILTGTNTYSGTTAVSAGTLQVGAGGTTGSIDSNSGTSVASGALLKFNRSNAYSSTKVISGAGSLEQAGTGAITLNAVNTYTGATTVSAGTLTLGINSALASASATTVASGATLGINGKTQTLASLTSSGTLDLGTNGSLTLTGNSSIGAITGSGTITVNSGAALTLT